jgi:hypothetical protein
VDAVSDEPTEAECAEQREGLELPSEQKYVALTQKS